MRLRREAVFAMRDDHVFPRLERYDADMPYRQGRTRPWHGPGHFDDPFMIPDPSPIGEGQSQCRPALIALTIIGVVILALGLLTVL